MLNPLRKYKILLKLINSNSILIVPAFLILYIWLTLKGDVRFALNFWKVKSSKDNHKITVKVVVCHNLSPLLGRLKLLIL